MIKCYSCESDYGRQDITFMEFSYESIDMGHGLATCTGYTPICRSCLDDLERRTAELLEHL